ncbi:MAG: hypothetical protein PHI63_00445 [Patescibacteria group bacterium]|nr:hypothetical protein [Patescibacteria group bacterium]
MKKTIPALIYWTPRIVSILFTAFIALFSLDVFGQGYGFWGTALAFFMHNIPTLVLLAVVLVAWKYEIVGGVAFILAGLLYVAMMVLAAVKNPFAWYMVSYSLIIAGPAFAIGIMFLLNWQRKRSA